MQTLLLVYPCPSPLSLHVQLVSLSLQILDLAALLQLLLRLKVLDLTLLLGNVPLQNKVGNSGM